jgi:hypothetical protein
VIAIVAERSPGTGDRHDRGVAEAFVGLVHFLRSKRSRVIAPTR